MNLTEIKARAEKATKGPWRVTGRVRRHIKNIDDWYILEGTQGNGGVRFLNDSDFIAHSRQDIPDLIAEVERLTAELARAEEVMRECRKLSRSADEFIRVHYFSYKDSHGTE